MKDAFTAIAIAFLLSTWTIGIWVILIFTILDWISDT